MSDDQLNHIERMLTVRYWFFVAIYVVMGLQCWLIYLNSTAIRAVEQRQTEMDSRSAQNRAEIESAIRQQIIFQTTLAQIMDKLSKDNFGKIKVPRVPMHPPRPTITPDRYSPPSTPAPTPEAPLPNTTESELTRSNTQPSTVTKPSVKKNSTRKRKPKPTPTPSPWYKFFKATR